MYKITITKIEKVKHLEEPKWQVVDRRPYTEKELQEYSASRYGVNREQISAEDRKEVYGYPPPREVEAEETHEVYSQRVNDMNLAKVIMAVNDLKT